MISEIKDICERLLDTPAPPLRSGAEMVHLAQRAHRRRHAGFAVVGAGLAVVAVAAAATAVPLLDGSGTGSEGGFGAATTTAAPASPPSSVGVASARPSHDLGMVVRTVKVSEVVSDMAAKAGAVRTLSIPDGQFLYVRTSARDTSDGSLHQMWLEPQGMIAVLVDRDDIGRAPTSTLELQAARTRFAQDGPSLLMPSPQWLATLPTNADALLHMVDAVNAGAKLGGKRYEFKQISELFWQCGAVLTPRVRAAFYRALGRISGVTATELRVDGRRLYALRQPDNGKGFAEELLMDPSTGQVVGLRSLQLGREATPTELAFWRYGAVAEVGQSR
jgi:hypothetical protein